MAKGDLANRYCPKCGFISFAYSKCQFCASKQEMKESVESHFGMNLDEWLEIPRSECKKLEEKFLDEVIKKNPEFSESAHQHYLRQSKQNIEMNRKIAKIMGNDQYKPKCPTCGSPDVNPISLGKKATGGLLFGLFSSNVRKSYECRNCKYKW